MALVLFAMSASVFAGDNSHDGTVVSVTSSKLVMKSLDGKEHSHSIGDQAKVTLDGKPAQADKLTAGTKIRVTTLDGDIKVATGIEAISKNETFANTHDGKVVSMTSSKLVMTNKDGKEHSVSISDDTKVTCDGKACEMSDLKAGMKIRVTTSATDKGAAVNVEALDKNSKFI